MSGPGGASLVLETPRLRLRRMELDDTAFVIDLLNQPSFLQYIGDKGVRNREDAERYIRTGPLASYAQHGFGLYVVEAREGGEPLGICGLIKREALADVDVGFAFLPRFWGQGLAREAAEAVIEEGRTTFRLPRLLAITSPDNEPSIGLLARLGFRYEGLVRLTPEASEVKLFRRDLRGGAECH